MPCSPLQIDVLPGIVDAVDGKMEVYVDGGIRSGADALKALALGARAVFIGRPALWALAYKVRYKPRVIQHCKWRMCKLLGRSGNILRLLVK